MKIMHCVDVPFQFDVDLFENILKINDEIINYVCHRQYDPESKTGFKECDDMIENDINNKSIICTWSGTPNI